MEQVNVLVTGAGAPGIRGTVYSLRNNWDERKMKIVGVDMRDDAVGKYFCDQFHRVPGAKSEDFVSTVLDICRREQIDVILPQVTNELFLFSRFKKNFEDEGIKVAVSGYDQINIANDKHKFMDIVKQAGGLAPESYQVSTWGDLIRAGDKVGYPFAVKPPVSNGMRGFRVVYEQTDRKKAFYDEKPDNTKVTLRDLYEILGDEFPPLLVMEYLPGKEYSVDILSGKDKVYAIVPRARSLIRSGITFNGIVEQRADIIDISRKVTLDLGLEYAHGIQYKEDREGRPRVLESNPRVQGTMVLSTIAGANVIYGSIKLALKEEIPDFNVCWNAKIFRYWGGIGINDIVNHAEAI